ncbi:MAG TPA: CoA ester lyase [Burkholderiaceae bacterium]|nr:CoA ester lyase [Burkholderiaceae bacterium]HMZ02068.1 CoA ester lyase [Burkholderiaceae bacterium]HNB44907.1 CoA ester lyase [Burkholderiaceae bacterium]HNG80330.1 CoA ester lyase [Burkholderiaceae bacterium]
MTRSSPIGQHAPLALARSLLFVPGHRPERFAKALGSGADAVVLDLEDAVPPAEKARARSAIAQALPGLASAGLPVVLRIHTLASEAGALDLAWLAEQPAAALGGVMLAKAESAAQIGAVYQRLPATPLLPLVESAAGYQALPEIAAAPGVCRLVLGHIDFMADTGIRCSDDERELDPLRFAVAIQTRLNRLASAVDGVTVALDDKAGLQRNTRRALHFGFGGKLCIHPRQVAGIHAALAPSDEELTWARRVIDADRAAQGAAVQLDGRMVDLPVVLQARATLARARAA